MGVAEGIDVEDVDVGWCEQDVLDELENMLEKTRIDRKGIRTEVNICQGSMKINDAMNHMRYVEASDTMIEKKTLFVNSWVTVNVLVANCPSIDFTVTKIAAKDRYIMMPIQK